MAVATTVDVMRWLYELAKGKEFGSKRPNSAGDKTNGNLVKELRVAMLVVAGTQSFELAPGTEVVVYRSLTKYPSGGYGPKTNEALATIFLKENGRTVRQVSIRMNGRVDVRRIN